MIKIIWGKILQKTTQKKMKKNMWEKTLWQFTVICEES
jgi:hypothetical protein